MALQAPLTWRFQFASPGSQAFIADWLIGLSIELQLCRFIAGDDLSKLPLVSALPSPVQPGSQSLQFAEHPPTGAPFVSALPALDVRMHFCGTEIPHDSHRVNAARAYRSVQMPCDWYGGHVLKRNATAKHACSCDLRFR